MKIAILGSSLRFDILSSELTSLGYEVTTYSRADEIPQILEQDVIVLPIPTKSKEGFLNLGGDNKITPEALLGRTKAETLIISCNYSDNRRKTVDINKDEYFAFLNAVPTAEGAISIALKEKGMTMFSRSCLIVGFGRIGKILAHRLDGLKANITVAARNPKDLALIKALGLKGINIFSLEESINEYDIIFQTVPSPILTENVLSKVDNGTPIIELSSAMAGTDLAKAKELGLKVINAGGLPEKCAPHTAGMILFDSVIRIIKENHYANN